MINLLSNEQKVEIKAARQNVMLRHYSLFTLLTLGILGSFFAYAFWQVAYHQQAALSQNTSALNQLQQYEATKQRTLQYRSDLQVAKTILGSEFSFSDFLTNTGAAMVPNTIIETINLSTKTQSGQQQGAVIIDARAKSYEDALKLKDSLERSELFSNVSAPTISRPDKIDELEGIQETYLYSVKIEAIVTPLQGAASGN